MGKFFRFNPFRSLTVGGLAVLAINTAIQTADPTALTPQGVQIVNLVGAVITVLGLRNAAAKADQ
jgi:hypothetical protein